MNENTTLDDDPTYHIKVLELMINELPLGMRNPISSVLAQLIRALQKRETELATFIGTLKSHVQSELTDIQLNVKYLEFDLQTTKQERDALQDRLNKLS